MSQNNKLEQIAAGISAASSILKIINNEITPDSRSYVKPDMVCIIGDILKTLSEYSDDSRNPGLGRTLTKAASYGNVYRRLKDQYSTYGNRKPDKRMMLETMKAIQPVLKNPQQLFIDKVIRIHDIIES